MGATQVMNGVEEAWTLGFLIDVIMTRDPWMHRVDIARAVGAPMVLTADHDGVLVDDVVREWAARHGRPFTLRLTGPAGGRWVRAGRCWSTTRSSSAVRCPVADTPLCRLKYRSR
jgi:hypothetical protein